MSNKIGFKMRNKKNKRKRLKKVSRLHDVLEQHYEGYRYKKGLAVHESERHEIFNKKLRKFLIACNKKEFIPTKEYVEKEIVKIREEVDKELSMKDIDQDTMDPTRIDNNLECMDFNSILVSRAIDGDEYDKKEYLKIHGIVPLNRLNDKDVSFLHAAFKDISVLHKKDQCLLLELMMVVASAPINDDKKDRICDMLQRKARQRFKKYAIDNGHKTNFKYPFMIKVKDFLLDGDI